MDKQAIKLPRHVGIIMDGNGRWAEQHGLPRVRGHERGAKTVRLITEECARLGIEWVTLYAFSSENWRRPQKEINHLMRLLRQFLIKEREALMRNNLQLRAVGQIEKLPQPARDALAETISLTKNNSRMVLCLALSYGGRQELVDAARRISADVAKGVRSAESISESLFATYMYDPEATLRQGHLGHCTAVPSGVPAWRYLPMTYDYVSVVHVHSNYSDGTGSVPEIIDAAAKAGVDIVFLTDHDTLQPCKDGHAGRHGKVLLVVGTEISPDLNHYLAFGLPAETDVKSLASLRPQEYIDRAAGLGGFGFIAHPDHTGTKLFDVPSYRWEDWSVKRFTGLGIWDMMTDFEELLVGPDEALAAFTNFPHSMTGPKSESVARWDRLLASGEKIVGVGEVDNHAEHRKALGRDVTVFPYELAFKTIRMHLLLDAPFDKVTDQGGTDADTKRVLAALRDGRSYIAFDFDHDSRGLELCVVAGEKKAGIGDEVRFRPGMTAEFELPVRARVRVLLNGAVIWEKDNTNRGAVMIPAPGALRLEAFHGPRPWIMSNPIYVRF
ncbi:MAG: polyprenyl diphosphate synthase [Planctomycetota bacterium]|nr:polyprenyl diphosphate synthase [Planctomycetota bacterium]